MNEQQLRLVLTLAKLILKRMIKNTPIGKQLIVRI